MLASAVAASVRSRRHPTRRTGADRRSNKSTRTETFRSSVDGDTRCMQVFIDILTQFLVLLALIVVGALGWALRSWTLAILLGVIGVGLAGLVGGTLAYTLIDRGVPAKRFGEP